MPKIKVKDQTVQTGELGQTRTQTDGRTDAANYIIYLASRSITKRGFPAMHRHVAHGRRFTMMMRGKCILPSGCRDSYLNLSASRTNVPS